jgi:hypothetical protein
VQRLQYLGCRVDIRTDVESFAQRLPYLAQQAEQEYPVRHQVAFDITCEEGAYVIREDGDAVAGNMTAETAFETLFRRVHERAFATVPDDIRIHAASGTHDGGMFLFVGSPMAGKTTLALYLLREGMDLMGDELVLMRNGRAVTFPRKFYPREGSFDLLPPADYGGLPRVYDTDGATRVAVDPTTFGRPWRIRPLPVKAIFYLEPEFGGLSSCRPCTKVDMVRLVTEQCLPPKSNKGWIGDLCAMVNNATTIRLAVGDLRSASIAVRRALG